MNRFPIVCFKWKQQSEGYRLPSVVEYSARHVNVLENMLKRNVTVPYQLHCITDDPGGIHPCVKIIPLWDFYRNLGGCFNRLYLFSKDMEKIIGPKFLCIDLDCIIVGNINHIIGREEDFVMNSYKPLHPGENDQYYNGSMILMKAGAREHVWKNFNPETSPSLLKELEKAQFVIGSDQAWIRYCLGRSEKRFTEEDGVYEYRQARNGLPSNARIVFFSGRRDPSLKSDEWVQSCWH